MRALRIPITLTILILAIPISSEAQPGQRPNLAIRTECTNFSYGGTTYYFCVDINPVADCSGYSLQNPTPWPTFPSIIATRSDWPYSRLNYAPIWHPSLESGTWTDPSMLESFHWQAEFRMVPYPPSGPPLGPYSVWHDFDIFEPSSCMPGMPPPPKSSCELTPRYYMYALEDEKQPPGWQAYCYIISANGIPSVQIQASLCTPPGAQHTFKATNIPYGGWVYTDCHGDVSYGWPHWQSSWYRPQYAK